jgi:ligand-binding SRPBCC domain-containing protein
MKHLVFEQFLPISLEEAWSFFSSPSNLNQITPHKLNFKMLDELPAQMYEGMLIRYRINPMLRIPVHWVTKITTIKDREYFIDEQIKGPYKIWHHEHHFRAVEGGVKMTDKLYYDIGFGIFGWLVGKVWVDKQVMEIFSYRSQKLKDLFSI